MLPNPVRILSLGLLLVLAACAQPGHTPWGSWGSAPSSDTAPALSLTTDAPSYYIPRATIIVRLTNRSNTRIDYDLCRASIDRFTGEDWQQAQVTLDEVCGSEMRTLFPGQAATFAYRADPMMRRGQYRIRAEVTAVRAGAGVPVISNSFKLESND